MTTHSTHNTRILLVEDDGMVRRLLAQILENGGYVVIQASNGIEALACLDSEPFELIVLDLLMPVMDGLKFLHELRQQRELHIPVLVLTASINSTNNSEQCILEAGADCVARKPVKAPQLLELLQQLLES